jgi:hypothetical protein
MPTFVASIILTRAPLTPFRTLCKVKRKILRVCRSDKDPVLGFFVFAIRERESLYGASGIFNHSLNISRSWCDDLPRFVGDCIFLDPSDSASGVTNLHPILVTDNDLDRRTAPKLENRFGVGRRRIVEQRNVDRRATRIDPCPGHGFQLRSRSAPSFSRLARPAQSFPMAVYPRAHIFCALWASIGAGRMSVAHSPTTIVAVKARTIPTSISSNICSSVTFPRVSFYSRGCRRLRRT